MNHRTHRLYPEQKSEMSAITDAFQAFQELHALLPDSLLFGSFFLYLLTHHLALGVFSIFLLEVVGAHRAFTWFFSQAVGPSGSATPRCRAGFKTPQYQYQRIFSHESYPSYSAFSVTAIATYLGLSTRAFAPTMEEMGREWSTRVTVAYAFIGLFLFAFLVARLWTCDAASEIAVAVVLALITGTVFFLLNQAVFGPEAVNFLGLPYLVRKDEEGAPIYVCASQDVPRK